MDSVSRPPDAGRAVGSLPVVARGERLQLAWISNVVAKGVVVGVQTAAVPAAFRVLKPEGFAVYAAATASAAMLTFFGAGMSGALVTRLASADSRKNVREQAVLFSTAWGFCLVLAAFGLALSAAMILVLPTKTLLGRASTGASTSDVRATLLVATAVLFLSFPLGLVDAARLSLQEVHRSNLFSLASSGLLVLGLGAAVYARASVPWFATVMLVPGLVARVLNAADLWRGRPFLQPSWRHMDLHLGWRLLGDGLIYLASTFTAFLLYHWPVYLAARRMAPHDSASLALQFQVMVMAIAVAINFIQPAWGAVAESHASGDYSWIGRSLRSARRAVVFFGLLLVLGFAFPGRPILTWWFGPRFHCDAGTLGLVGLYGAFAVWEYLHYTFLLGVGDLRRSCLTVAARAVVFAAAAPFLLQLYGPPGLFVGLLLSVAGSTAWIYPRTLRRHVSVTMCQNETVTAP